MFIQKGQRISAVWGGVGLGKEKRGGRHLNKEEFQMSL